MDEDGPGLGASKIEPATAGKIADEEIADLKKWLESRWNATPRDTAILKKASVDRARRRQADRNGRRRHRICWRSWSRRITRSFGHMDLMVIGGYSLATWLTERISNEVASRTRLTNQRITNQFAALAHEQIVKMCALACNTARRRREHSINSRRRRIGYRKHYRMRA